MTVDVNQGSGQTPDLYEKFMRTAIRALSNFYVKAAIFRRDAGIDARRARDRPVRP
jgi:hypothetical protein